MRSWRALATEAILSGSLASLFSGAALALSGWREGAGAFAPLNAPSQWLWGPAEALAADGPSPRHTLAGYAVHHVASTFWSTLHAIAFARRRGLDRPLPALAAATATTAVAALVDLKMCPERFTPGFQHRISRPALFATYACFALGLAAGGLLARRRRATCRPS
ncbi:hypothetical protein [Ramlibacter sp.]|uniref:hypothetical protein n=1 Tax=Ramlibacter sp. TaxID=1917967 RepID=UPI002D3650D8|nr:hypothetical protein [Ramlibacter sp.]HYD75051.1 hypothetical protein [Ramlibacter sp.]